MSMDEARQTFAQEAAELLQQMEDALLSLEAQPGDEELLHQVFRAMHTIKGSAGIFGFDEVVHFTHPVESVMDEVRAGSRELNAELIAVLLECRDHTANLVEAVLSTPDPQNIDAELRQRGDMLLAQLQSGDGEKADASRLTANGDSRLEIVADREVSAECWVISLRFGENALRNGMDPLSFIRYLGNLGSIDQVITDTSRLPVADDFDPESCYLGFRIFFTTEADKKKIEEVFEFAADDCEISILPPQSRVENYLSLLEGLPEDQVQMIGEMLCTVGALTEREVEQALRRQVSAGPDGEVDKSKLGELVVEQQAIQQSVVDHALQKQDKARQKVAQESQYIRVDAQRLGRLIDLVGELVIGSAAMRVMVNRHGIDDMQDVVDGVDHLVEEIRDNALQLRMVQIGDTFSRFRRVVRDVSKELGKSIELVIEGGDTELDKTVVEKITDPLTHLIRNSLDHGIEMQDARIAAGKPARGTLWLNAYHDSGHIVIEIRDDGAGLDADRIRAKAVEKGLVRTDQILSHEETLRLIFEPGLSTKDSASDLSGRGVGMDVVRRNIESLRGSVELESELGVGTKVTIILPLTLAIIDGFLVGSGAEQYVIPLAQVVECVEIGHEEVKTQCQHYINLRGEVLPYMRLRQFFDLCDADRVGRESLVVVRFGHHTAGLVVDELYGELQTVIKPLGKIFEHLKGVAGATVLGTGGIALILDVQELTTLLHAKDRAGTARLAH